MISRILLGAAAAGIVTAAAARTRLLTRSGAVTGAIIGAAAVAAGWSWAVLLVAFFVLTSALSAVGAGRKSELARDVNAKGAARDAVQVLANGGVFAAAGIAWVSTGADLWLATGAGAIAAAAADSWATELGVAFGGEPRSIISGRSLKRGMSGGITPVGSLGALAGAFVIAGTVLIIGWPQLAAVAAILAGAFGMIIDSVLGATVQARRFCARCAAPTEQTIHSCGASTVITGGIAWMSNDMVNVLATLTGAIVAGVVFSAV